MNECYKRVSHFESYSTPLRPITLPLLEIQGRGEGPRLSIVAGMNATQYLGTLTCLRLFEEIDCNSLSGKLTLIPVANPNGLDQRETYSVPDEDDFNGKVNLNRVFPGKPADSPPRSLAHSVFSKILSSSDYLIDIHGGDLMEDILPCVMYTVVASRNPKSRLARIDEESRRLAVSTGLEFVIETLCDMSKRGRIHVEACFKEIPSINIEVARSGENDEDYYETLKEALYNSMFHLGLLRGNASNVSKWISHRNTRKYISDLVQVRSSAGGLFQSSLEVGRELLKGEKLGDIVGLDAGIREDLFSPIDGVLVERRTNPVVNSGDVVCEVGSFQPR